MEPKESKSNTHFTLSIIKSFVRFMAGGAMVMSNDMIIIIAGVLIIVAEVLGVAEEIF